MTKLVIVESPTKARTIRGYLPDGYHVEASMGHVRDLPASAAEIPAAYKGESWSRLGVNVEEDFDPLYVVPSDKKKVVTALRKELKKADELILATDEDREGESIGWHLTEVLKPKVPVQRMVFHEITQEAILQALQHTRDDRRGPGAGAGDAAHIGSAWWDTRCRRCCGRRWRRSCRPGACRASQCGCWWSGSGSDGRSTPARIGI